MTNSIKGSRSWLGRWGVWVVFALVLLVVPRVFTSNLSQTLLAQMGIAIIACLSYNILLGQGGMLSFGHAVYTGLGAYMTMHALNAVGAGQLGLPVTLLPLVGGLAGMGFAILLGWVTTRKSGTPFAMITLGVAELVFAMSLMFSEFFGGEAGVSGNRMVGDPVWGISYGPQIQVYYLIAAYTLVCVALMYAFTQTPLGRILNAVRDNPERVEFIGYNTQRVRYQAFIVAGFFAGIAGGLSAINFEIVTAEAVGSARSGAYLLFTYLGGPTYFFGPILGAVLMVVAFVLLSELTKAWLLYLGLSFLLMVMYAPGGLASLIMMTWRVIRMGKFGHIWTHYLSLVVTGLLLLMGAGAVFEMIYHLKLNAGLGDEMRFMGLTLDAVSPKTWVAVLAFTGLALLAFEWVRRRFVTQWEHVQAMIAHDIQAGEGQA